MRTFARFAMLLLLSCALATPSFSQTLKIFSATAGPADHPEATAVVEQGWLLVGGGAKVEWDGTSPGNLLTASFPSDNNQWVARSKDHSVSSPAKLTAYAVGLDNRKNEWEVKTWTNTSAKEAHPSARVEIDDDWTLTGCGAQVDYGGGPGNLLTAVYPVSQSTCEAKSKDHSVSSPATITVYAIGVRKRSGTPLANKVVSQTSPTLGHPSAETKLSAGFKLTGGGAFVDYGGGPGNLLLSAFPDNNNVFRAASKDHSAPSPATITVYAIGIKE